MHLYSNTLFSILDVDKLAAHVLVHTAANKVVSNDQRRLLKSSSIIIKRCILLHHHHNINTTRISASHQISVLDKMTRDYESS